MTWCMNVQIARIIILVRQVDVWWKELTNTREKTKIRIY